jgi:hypothetical protein
MWKTKTPKDASGTNVSVIISALQSCINSTSLCINFTVYQPHCVSTSLCINLTVYQPHCVSTSLCINLNVLSVIISEFEKGMICSHGGEGNETSLDGCRTRCQPITALNSSFQWRAETITVWRVNLQHMEAWAHKGFQRTHFNRQTVVYRDSSPECHHFLQLARLSSGQGVSTTTNSRLLLLC